MSLFKKDPSPLAGANTNDLVAYQPPGLDATPHPLVIAEQRAGQIVARVMAGMSTMLNEHMRAVKLELQAITNDNSVLRQNLALLNGAMGDFQRLQVIPLRESLEHLRDEQGSVVIENARKLEGLIQALSKSLDAAGGLIPGDLKAQIADGRFENLDHRKANETGGDEIRGYVPEHVVKDMIEAAVAEELARRGIS